MILLAIFGSSRKEGNTDLMLDSFLEGASSAETSLKIERIYTRELAISGCLSCGYCDKHGACVQKDEMQRVYPLFDSAERIVMASPIYFYGLPGQTKMLVDRSQAPFMRKYKGVGTPPPTLPGPRKGFFLSAGATRGARLFDCPILTVKYFFDALDVAYTGELCYKQIDEKGAIRNHPTALEECRKAGREFVL